LKSPGPYINAAGKRKPGKGIAVVGAEIAIGILASIFGWGWMFHIFYLT
jgi:hypothetical protein